MFRKKISTYTRYDDIYFAVTNVSNVPVVLRLLFCLILNNIMLTRILYTQKVIHINPPFVLCVMNSSFGLILRSSPVQRLE